MKKQSILSLLGLPGSGKSTLAKNLVAFGLDHLEGGAVARSLAAVDHEVAAALARGEMAPRVKMNTAMVGAVENAMSVGKSIVIDGYPRYMTQYQDLLTVGLSKAELYFVILGCNEDLAKSRLVARKRADDTNAIIDARLSNYWVETYPLYNQLAAEHASNTLHVAVGTPQDQLNAVVDFLKQRNAI